MKNSQPEVKLRALEPEDIDLLYEWENDHSIWYVSNTLTPFSKYILKKYIENSHLDIYQTKQLRLMIDVCREADPETVGAIDIFDFDPFHLRAGVGVLIAREEDRNKGLAGLALQELIQYAFGILHLHQLYCNISSDNKISLRLFQEAGFVICGKKKDWLKAANGYKDELLLQLIRNGP